MAIEYALVCRRPFSRQEQEFLGTLVPFLSLEFFDGHPEGDRFVFRSLRAAHARFPLDAPQVMEIYVSNEVAEEAVELMQDLELFAGGMLFLEEERDLTEEEIFERLADLKSPREGSLAAFLFEERFNGLSGYQPEIKPLRDPCGGSDLVIYNQAHQEVAVVQVQDVLRQKLPKLEERMLDLGNGWQQAIGSFVLTRELATGPLRKIWEESAQRGESAFTLIFARAAPVRDLRGEEE